MSATLFPIERPPTQVGRRARELDQFFTPEWAADALVEQFFGDLSADDLVLEPSAGRGAFLKAVPGHVPAVGVEIDPELAAEAQANSGRPVLCGDFRTIDLDVRPTVMVGNPPFRMDVFEGFLRRARQLLPDNGRCGFLLPINALQTPGRVLRWNEHWGLEGHMVPRTLFPRSRWPLVFCLFGRRTTRVMTGFALYREAAGVHHMPRAARILLINGEPRKPCWRAVVEWALRGLGGEAHLEHIYARVEPRRPSENQWWREKVRQTLQRHFEPVGRGVWRLA
jgi:hypothetical protein